MLTQWNIPGVLGWATAITTITMARITPGGWCLWITSPMAQWPREGDGFDRRFGWRTQPAPEMEQFPEKTGLGPKGVETRPEFDPNKVPSNASRSSRIARGAVNAIGRFLEGFFSVVGGTTMDIFGVVLGPSFLLDQCKRDPYMILVAERERFIEVGRPGTLGVSASVIPTSADREITPTANYLGHGPSES
jgi:hypothetical protein